MVFRPPTWILLGLTLGLISLHGGEPTTATNTLPSDPTELLRQENDLFATAIKMFGALAVVLAVFGTFVLVVRKWGPLTPNANSSRDLNVVESRVLAHKTYVYVMEHRDERFLMSVGPQGTAFHPLTPDLKTASPASEAFEWPTQEDPQ